MNVKIKECNSGNCDKLNNWIICLFSETVSCLWMIQSMIDMKTLIFQSDSPIGSLWTTPCEQFDRELYRTIFDVVLLKVVQETQWIFSNSKQQQFEGHLATMQCVVDPETQILLSAGSHIKDLNLKCWVRGNLQPPKLTSSQPPDYLE